MNNFICCQVTPSLISFAKGSWNWHTSEDATIKMGWHNLVEKLLLFYDEFTSQYSE